jgi:hypothetical protein
MNRKSLLVIFALIIVLLAAGYVFVVKKQTTSSGATDSNIAEPIIIDTSDWKTYQNKRFGFQFKYPANAKVCDVPTRDGEEVVLSLAIITNGKCSELVKATATAMDPIRLNVITLEINNIMALNDQVKDPQNPVIDISGADRSQNPALGEFLIDGLQSYGGPFKRMSSVNPRGQREYLATFTHEGRSFYMWDHDYDANRRTTDNLVRSLRFDPALYPRYQPGCEYNVVEGIITNLASSSITIKSQSGKITELIINDYTTFYEVGRRPISSSSFKLGQWTAGWGKMCGSYPPPSFAPMWISKWYAPGKAPSNAK